MLFSFWTFVIVALVMAEHGWGAVIAGVGSGFVVFWLESWLWPNAKCLWCRGKSRRYHVDGTAWRHCWRCGGSGRRRRPFSGNLP